MDELNFFAGKTNKENPAKVFVDQNNDIVIMTSFMKKTIVDHPTDIYDTLKTNELQDLKMKDNHIENIFTSITKNRKSYIEPRGGQKSLNVVIRETQSNLPWFAGYVAAMITSYKTGGIYYARDVANFAGVNESSEISRSQLIKFAKSKGLSPNETVFDVSSSSLGKQIENNRPVYVGVKNLSNTSSSHALTIRGYSYDGSKNDVSGFSVWNPWYNSFEWMGANQIYVDRSGTRYEAEYYVINCKVVM